MSLNYNVLLNVLLFLNKIGSCQLKISIHEITIYFFQSNYLFNGRHIIIYCSSASNFLTTQLDAWISFVACAASELFE